MTDNQKNPYKGLPDHCFWSRAHRRASHEVDPVLKGKFKITPEMNIATAGSCFAQHIARELKRNGYNYFVTEKAHPIVDPNIAAEFNYGTFTARFGNLYTVRQLLQLAKRARGDFKPKEDAWQDDKGNFIDPYRPAIQPGGFSRRDDFNADRDRHFQAVRRLMDEADVFVFTFGLTEAWVSKMDGAVFPLAPGVAGGKFDPAKHEFINFSVSEIVADFKEFVGLLRQNNPKVKVLMTVSPVPLMATARKDESVISATTYSKAVLRVACEELQSTLEACYYFPSYEIITGISSRGAYYASDLRDVTSEGVGHVMRLFMEHYTEEKNAGSSLTEVKNSKEAGFQEQVESALQIICDEELIGD